jgi:hypothetical protein
MLRISAIVSGREVCRGRTPRVWVDGVLIPLNVERNERKSWPEPNLDARFFATCEGIESASDRVETFTVGNRLGNLGSTALVIVIRDITVRRDGRSANTPVSHLLSRPAKEGLLTRFGASFVAWYSLEGYATKSGFL